MKLVVELAESAASNADSNADQAKVGVWVRATDSRINKEGKPTVESRNFRPLTIS